MIRAALSAVLVVGQRVSPFAAAMPSDGISYFGRWDFSEDYPRADWPGAGFTFHVSNSSTDSTVDIKLAVLTESADSNFVSVLVDCAVLGKYEVTYGEQSVEFSIDVAAGQTYEVNVIKVTESFQGILSYKDVTVRGADIVSGIDSTCRNKNGINLLFVGDSNTAAYGVEGQDPCAFSADTENILDSYATFVANDLGAEVHSIAWSGKGVVRNYGDQMTTSVDPMPDYYNRTIGELSDPSLVWKPSSYEPDVVMVMLGANDYSTEPHPSDEDFTSGLVALLHQIHTDYPTAKVGAMCSPHPGGNQCKNIQKAAELTSCTYTQIDDSVLVSFGCDGHPSIESQRNIADVVTPVVRDMLSVDQ